MPTELFLGIAILASYVLIFILGTLYIENKIAKIINVVFIELIVWCSGVLFQKILGPSMPDCLIYFDYVTYIGICAVFPTCIYLSYAFINDQKMPPKFYALIFVVPIICLILLWTNDFHHLFYKVYSTNFADTEYGVVFYINTIYSYAVALVFIVQMIRASILNTGILSKQTVLLVLGSLIPLVINVLGTTKILNISIYATPITFVITLVCYAIAIFRYKALKLTPIALKTIIDTMNDAFIVMSLDGTVVETNREYKENLQKYIDVQSQSNLLDELIKSNDKKLIEFEKVIKKCINEKNADLYELEFVEDEENEVIKYFEASISLISSRRDKKNFIGVLILIKDISEHKRDMLELKRKQDIITKQAQLVSIGELAGGVAHDINTPISAIRTGISMLKASDVERSEEEKNIIETMDNCSTKIINMVNSMRNQIRNLGGNTEIVFKISDVVNDIKCITFHETKKYNAEVEVEIEEDLKVKGDPAKLGQVLTNLVMNAAQAYGSYSKDGGKINIIVSSGPQDMAVIKVIDFAGGMDESIKNSVFKSMLTTKGSEGTGLGLYLAYSVIKGNFNGDINFDSEKGTGTTFYIKIPQVKE